MASTDNKPLGRYMRVLEVVAASPDGMTLSEVAQELELQAGTVHRLIQGLLELDLLRRPAGAKTYVPGLRLQSLLQRTMNTGGYAGFVEASLDELVREFGETAHLARLSDDVAESVLMSQPNGADRTFVQPGRQLPLYAAASGKVILAFQQEEFIARFLARPRVSFTEKTKIKSSEILEELAEIRRNRMAVCDGELDAGVLSYGLPVRVRGGHVLYSVGITGLADRFHLIPRERIYEKLSEAADTLSRKFGSEA